MRVQEGQSVFIIVARVRVLAGAILSPLYPAQAAGDLLWQLGDKAPPNDGFTAARIFPTQAALAAAEAAAAGTAAAGGEGGSSSSGAADAPGEAAEQLGGLQLGQGGGSAEAEGGEAAAAAGAAGGALDMDALLDAAVLAGLQALKNADLPIQAGDFYTKFMVPAKPEGEEQPSDGQEACAVSHRGSRGALLLGGAARAPAACVRRVPPLPPSAAVYAVFT